VIEKMRAIKLESKSIEYIDEEVSRKSKLNSVIVAYILTKETSV
jgi:hypothetical protein